MDSLQSIQVVHNMEVAHRLYMMPGKCENIHGHSMRVYLTLYGLVDDKGVLAGLQFGNVKKVFRTWIDENFDHHLLLNQEDPWAQSLWTDKKDNFDVGMLGVSANLGRLPGLQVMPADPTTENIAKWIGQWAWETYATYTPNVLGIHIKVDETPVNSGSWERRRYRFAG